MANDTGAFRDIDLPTLVRTLWNSKFRIIFAALVAAVLAVAYVQKVAVPRYPATAVIALEDQEQRVIGDIESVISGGVQGSLGINTEVGVMRSRILMGRLVEQLNLVEDPEFNNVLNRQMEEATRPEWLAAIYELRYSILGAPKTPPAEVIYNRVIDRVIASVAVRNQSQSLIFNITTTTNDPLKSALISNTLAELYINDQRLQKFEANKRASEFLSTRAAELQISLEEIEGTRNAFFEREEQITPEALAASNAQLREQRRRILNLQELLATQTSLYDRLVVLQDDPARFIELANDPLLRDRTAETAGIKEAITNSLERRETEISRTRQQVETLQDAANQLMERITKQSQELIELQQVERELEATRLLYQSFLSRLKETNVQEGLQLPDSRLLSSAVPRPASSPNKRVTIVLWALVAVVLASILSLWRELSAKGIRTSQELSDLTKVTVLGNIPNAKTKTRRDTVNYLRDKQSSVIAEAIRNLRTSIMMSNLDKPPQVILLTSSVPGEGKTTLSIALANNFKGLGDKVLLIEGDIRRRTFSEYLDKDTKTTSLLQLIANPDLIDKTDVHVPMMGVDTIVGDKSDLNAADVFSSQKFADLLKKLRKKYDRIIIDSPPVLAVTDARIIRPLADACIYVVHWDKTSRTQVRQGIDAFRDFDQEVTGVVLGKIDNNAMKRYGYGGSYGYDSYQNKYYE